MILGLGHGLGFGGRVPGLPLPSGFTFPAAYTPVIRADGSGGYTASINARGFVSAAFDGPTYYVSPSGSDSNGGLSVGQAVRSIWKALQLGNATSAAYQVSVAAGNYPRPNGINGSSNVYPTQDVAIVATGGRVVTGAWDDLSWPGSPDATFPNTYKVARSNVLRVFDIATPNSYGDYTELTKVADAATCNSTVNSWAQVGGDLYVNRGGAVTNANTRAYLNANAAQFDATSKSVYLEGVDVEGGTTGGVDVRGTVTRNIVAVDCSAKYVGGPSTNLFDAFRVRDLTGIALFVRCTASAAAKDGFNAHWDLGGASGLYMVTIDCVGRDNGRFTSTSNNGLTLHDTIAGIDVGGDYTANFGGNVHIVEQTTLWCVGTQASDSEGDTSLGGTFVPTDFWTGNTSQMWVEGTTATGSTRSLVADTGSTIYKRNHTSGGTESGGGTITTF